MRPHRSGSSTLQGYQYRFLLEVGAEIFWHEKRIHAHTDMIADCDDGPPALLQETDKFRLSRGRGSIQAVQEKFREYTDGA